MSRQCSQIAMFIAAVLMLGMLGCEVDSYFDPSKTGRFEFTPTTIPILERIDVIEREQDPWAKATGVTPQDLQPNDLTYRLSPGDVVTVEIFELMATGQVTSTTRRLDAGGYIRIPVLGDILAAGLTAQELQDKIYIVVERDVMPNPVINVAIEEGAGFRYTMYGAVQGTGIYALSRPDFRLLAALAQAGGVAMGTQKVFVIRQVPLTEAVEFQPARTRERPKPPAGQQPAVDIEDLIDQLERNNNDDGDVSPAALRQEGEPVIDIDDLEPPRVPQEPVADTVPVATQPDILPRQPGQRDSFIYIEERGEWVRVPSREAGRDEEAPTATQPSADLILERIIEIPYAKLKQGDSSYNIVIRPDDWIYVQEPAMGVVYIDGEIARPGVYNMPVAGRLTLSRLVAAAGGPGALAVPERVDLTRIVGENREATLRLNLAAIRQKTEPDLYLKPDDHIIIGTSWIATPLAVFRNGLRMTYGFGFLLDRNFGNDVFGAPPFSRVQ